MKRMSRFVIVKGIPIIPPFAALHGFFCGMLRNPAMANAYISRLVACQGTFDDENAMKLEKVTSRDREELVRLNRAVADREERLARTPSYETDNKPVEMTLKQTIRAIRREDRERLLAQRDIHGAREDIGEIETRIASNERIARLRLEKSRHLCNQCVSAYLAGNAVFFRGFVPNAYQMSGHTPDQPIQ